MRFAFNIDGREYRTDGEKSSISGRLLLVESKRACGAWRQVKNASRREEVLRLFEGEVA